MTRTSFLSRWAAVTVVMPLLVLPAKAEDMTIKIDNFVFSPQALTIKAGTKVTWVNEDDIPHTVASTTQGLRSKALDTGDTYSFTFTTPGTYKYFCGLHPHMTRSIVVEGTTGSNTPR